MALIFANVIIVFTMGFILWWFWFYTPAVQESQSDSQHLLIDIQVEHGVYQPDRIRVHANQEITLRFHRQDPSPCAEQVTFPDLKLGAELSLQQPTELKLPKLTPGRYGFSCQMQMYRGEVEVV